MEQQLKQKKPKSWVHPQLSKYTFLKYLYNWVIWK